MSLKLSLIVTTYNLEKYIGKCLKSIFNNESNYFEVIVVDDGSTDNTINEIQKFNGDSRMKVITQKNSGVVIARKNGFLESKGKFVWFIDGDDWVTDGAIDYLIEKTESLYDVYLFNYMNIFDTFNEPSKKNIINEELNEYEFLKGLLINKYDGSLWNKIFRKDFILENKIKFFEKLRVGEDTTFSINVGIYKPKVKILDKCLYNYYQRCDSVTRVMTEKLMDIKYMFDIIEEIINQIDLNFSEEINYFIYMHSLKYRIKEIFIYKSDYSYQYFSIWKKKNINIFKNKYFKDEKISKEKIIVYLACTNYNIAKLACAFVNK